MATTAHTVTARKAFPCEDYLCGVTVQIGDEYARHVVFPNDETNQSDRPWVLRICRSSQTRYGRPMPPRPRATTTVAASARNVRGQEDPTRAVDVKRPALCQQDGLPRIEDEPKGRFQTTEQHVISKSRALRRQDANPTRRSVCALTRGRTMTYIAETTFLGVRCDKPSCDRSFRIGNPKRGDYFGTRDRSRQEAERRGWTFWVGRSQRAYCPPHGPSLPTQMRRLAPMDGGPE